ncbi:MAG: tetratricopeptide repeat protein [Alphaproteobacteria bacterium]
MVISTAASSQHTRNEHTSDVGAFFDAALALHRAGDLEGSLRFHLAVLAGDPGHEGALANLGELRRDLLQAGFAHHRAGRRAEAEHCYHLVLSFNGDDADALHLLGVLAHQAGDDATAAEILSGVVTRAPSHHQARCNLGVALSGLGRIDEAITHYQIVLEAVPDHAVVNNNLGSALVNRGRAVEAIACFRRALAVAPETPGVLANLGNALNHAGRNAEAEEVCRRALAIDPDFVDAHVNLGNAIKELGDGPGATALFQRAIALKPDSVVALNNLGNAMKDERRFAEALDYFDRALAIDEAFAEGHLNRAGALKEIGRHQEAIAGFRRALDLDPRQAVAHSNLIFALQYDPRTTGVELRDECLRWTRMHGGATPVPPHANDPDPDRRLRVGYVSSDFRDHAVSFYVEPMLAHHDADRFEVFCYSNHPLEDGVSARLRRYAHHWVETRSLDDEAMAARIRADAIDILIDCAGHTSGNRLRALARRPAPVQIATYFGHGGTTGPFLDHLLTDSRFTPPGYEEQFCERLIRLPEFIAPFQPRSDWPDVTPLPPEGPPVFAFLGDPARVAPEVMDLWAEMLDAVPGARFLLKHGTFDDQRLMDHWRGHFRALGDRLDIEGLPGGWGVGMEVYSRISVALDSFPVTGGTSTLIPLWMGVPVVSLVGHHVGQRSGASMLPAVGVPELVAGTPKEYVEKAVELSQDRQRLTFLRRNLRDMMRHSAVCDAPRVMRHIEESLRDVWRDWCRDRR